MRVRATASFLDLKANKPREIGDEWEVSQERLQQLIASGYCVEVKDAKNKLRRVKTK